MTTLVTGIAELTTCDEQWALSGAPADEARLGIVRDAALIIDPAGPGGDGTIAWVGSAGDAPAADHRIDLGGRAVIPGFVDSHTHLVYAGDRADEFAARMGGTAYDGGGIARTVAATRAVGDRPRRRPDHRRGVRRSGTITAVRVSAATVWLRASASTR